MMRKKPSLTGLLVLGLAAMPAMAGTTITPMQGSLGNPFDNGTVHGWVWNGVQGGGAGSLIGNLYDNILIINGGAAGVRFGNPFLYFPTTGYVDSNIQVALSGFHIPAPAVMSLLGLGGQAIPRRRRSR